MSLMQLEVLAQEEFVAHQSQKINKMMGIAMCFIKSERIFKKKKKSEFPIFFLTRRTNKENSQ
jgi:hypothetical protein